MLIPTEINKQFPKDPNAIWSFKGGSKIACVLIHGFTGLPSEMRPVGKVLMDNNISHESILLPGHGSSVIKMAENNWIDWYDIVLDKVVRLRENYEIVVAIGLSMGGTIALKLASEGMVDGVCSIAGPVLQPDKRMYLAKFVAKWKVIRKKKVDPNPYKYLVADSFLGYTNHAYHAIFQLYLLLKNVRRSLKKINVPVLLIHSKLDRVVPYKNMKYIEKNIGSDSIDCVRLEKSNHVITWDVESEKINTAIMDYIRKQFGGLNS